MNANSRAYRASTCEMVGECARGDGKPITANPFSLKYKHTAIDHASWERGWHRADSYKRALAAEAKKQSAEWDAIMTRFKNGYQF